jgi:predicted PhzF superfamily epimerase YddE/YHI9
VQFPYGVYQGAAVGRSGRLYISTEDGDIWVTGTTRTLIEGTLHAPTAHIIGPQLVKET